MKKIQKASAPFIISALWVVMLVVIGGVLVDSAHGATKAEIVYEAKNKYTSAAYSMSQIVNDAFDSAEASGIAPADISAALSQILIRFYPNRGNIYNNKNYYLAILYCSLMQ